MHIPQGLGNHVVESSPVNITVVIAIVELRSGNGQSKVQYPVIHKGDHIPNAALSALNCHIIQTDPVSALEDILHGIIGKGQTEGLGRFFHPPDKLGI